MRIEPLEEKKLPWSVRPIAWIMKRMFGRALTPYLVFARRPGLLWAVSLLSRAMMGEKVIPGSLKTLASIRAAQLIGCPF